MLTVLLKRGIRAATACVLGAAGLALHPDAARAAGSSEIALQVALGKRLFSDVLLSRDGKVSCASCHQTEHAFTDGKPVSVGFEGKKGSRNAMSLLNVASQKFFFWDGRRSRLEDLVLDPLVNPVEHAMADQSQVLTTLRATPAYQKAFRNAFPGVQPNPIQTEQLATALAAFVRSLNSPESAIDRFLIRKDNAALSPDARAGYQLFAGKAQCINCHSLKPDPINGRITLTDQDFHAHSASFYGMHQALEQQAKQILSRGKPLAEIARENPQTVDALGRFMVSGKMADVGAFKTPSLRNVARTAPYFHNGKVATLELALEQELLGQGSEQIPLTREERRLLLEFLKSLNDDK